MHIWVWQEDQVYARISNHKRSLIVEPIKYEKRERIDESSDR